jgi:hypothetical protein
MSRNLIIYKTGPMSQEREPLGDLGRVTDALNGAFIDLEWQSPVAAALPVDVEGGFQVKLTVQGGRVHDIYTDAGVNHIRQFAGLCKRQGWRMADAQAGEDVDLDDPQGWYEGRAGATGHRARGRFSSPLQGKTPTGTTGRRSGRIAKWVALFLVLAGLGALGFYLWRSLGK